MYSVALTLTLNKEMKIVMIHVQDHMTKVHNNQNIFFPRYYTIMTGGMH